MVATEFDSGLLLSGLLGSDLLDFVSFNINSDP